MKNRKKRTIASAKVTRKIDWSIELNLHSFLLRAKWNVSLSLRNFIPLFHTQNCGTAKVIDESISSLSVHPCATWNDEVQALVISDQLECSWRLSWTETWTINCSCLHLMRQLQWQRATRYKNCWQLFECSNCITKFLLSPLKANLLERAKNHYFPPVKDVSETCHVTQSVSSVLLLFQLSLSLSTSFKGTLSRRPVNSLWAWGKILVFSFDRLTVCRPCSWTWEAASVT